MQKDEGVEMTKFYWRGMAIIGVFLLVGESVELYFTPLHAINLPAMIAVLVLCIVFALIWSVSVWAFVSEAKEKAKDKEARDQRIETIIPVLEKAMAEDLDPALQTIGSIGIWTDDTGRLPGMIHFPEELWGVMDPLLIASAFATVVKGYKALRLKNNDGRALEAQARLAEILASRARVNEWQALTVTAMLAKRGIDPATDLFPRHDRRLLA